MLKIQLYHNPRCSKSRQTLALLQEKDAEIEIFEYLKTPPTPEMLNTVLEKLGKEPIELIRSKESIFKELGFSLNDQRSREEWIRILCETPKLIERPIAITENRALIGRPPEQVLDLF